MSHAPDPFFDDTEPLAPEGCPPLIDLAAWCDGSLYDATQEELDVHLARCARCLAIVSRDGGEEADPADAVAPTAIRAAQGLVVPPLRSPFRVGRSSRWIASAAALALAWAGFTVGGALRSTTASADGASVGFLSATLRAMRLETTASEEPAGLAVVASGRDEPVTIEWAIDRAMAFLLRGDRDESAAPGAAEDSLLEDAANLLLSTDLQDSAGGLTIIGRCFHISLSEVASC